MSGRGKRSQRRSSTRSTAGRSTGSKASPKATGGRSSKSDGKGGNSSLRKSTGSKRGGSRKAGKGTSAAGKQAQREFSPPAKGEVVYLLEVPYEMRQLAQYLGARWEPSLRSWVVRAAESDPLPESARLFRCEPFSWGRREERRLNGGDPAPDSHEDEEFEMYPHQRDAAEGIEAASHAGLPGFLLADEVGVGKAQPLDSLVLTPRGFKAMRDVSTGEEISHPRAGTTRVTGVYPQGEREIYRVTFSDNATTECDGDHLWEVTTTARKHRGNSSMVLPLKEIAPRLRMANGNPRYYIPMSGPLDLKCSADKELDPYLLGVLLGDGCLSSNAAHFSSADKEMASILGSLLPEGVMIKQGSGNNWRISRKAISGSNPVTDSLRGLGLSGKLSVEKFIPESYKYARFKERLALLQGLMDSDGEVTPGGKAAIFHTSSEMLACDFSWLVESIGGKVSRRHQEVYYTHRGEKRKGRDSWRIGLYLPRGLQPFRLSRKRNEWRTERKYEPTRCITDVEYVGRKEAQCIATAEEDGLYITDNFVVTHNSLSGLHGALGVPGITKLLIVCPLSVAAHWRGTLLRQRRFLEEAGVEVVVINYDRLKRLLSSPASEQQAKRTRTKNQRRAKEGKPLESFDVVIADESHRLRNPLSQTSQAFRSVAGDAFTIWASATAGQDPLELSYLSRLLAALTGESAKSLEEFEEWCRERGLGVKKGSFGKWEWDGSPEDIEYVHSLLFGDSNPGSPGLAAGIRRLPQEISGWPEIQRIARPVTLTASERRLYDEAWTTFREEMEMSSRGRDSANPMVIRQRFRQKCSLLRAEGTADTALEMLDNGYRPAISTNFRESLDAIAEHLENAGKSLSVIHGGITGKERESERLAFQRDQNEVALFSITEGISLHQGEEPGGDAPRVTLIHDPRRTGIENAQIEGRAHRNGVMAAVYYLYGERTVEEKVVKRLLQRMKSMKSMVGDDTSLIEELEALIDQGLGE